MCTAAHVTGVRVFRLSNVERIERIERLLALRQRAFGGELVQPLEQAASFGARLRLAIACARAQEHRENENEQAMGHDEHIRRRVRGESWRMFARFEKQARV